MRKFQNNTQSFFITSKSYFVSNILKFSTQKINFVHPWSSQNLLKFLRLILLRIYEKFRENRISNYSMHYSTNIEYSNIGKKPRIIRYSIFELTTLEESQESIVIAYLPSMLRSPSVMNHKFLFTLWCRWLSPWKLIMDVRKRVFRGNYL